MAGKPRLGTKFARHTQSQFRTIIPLGHCPNGRLFTSHVGRQKEGRLGAMNRLGLASW